MAKKKRIQIRPKRPTTMELRQHLRAYKADLVARGLCRQCKAKRGNSPSISRCRKCYLQAREQGRKAAGSNPWVRGNRGGRPPLDVLQHREKSIGRDLSVAEQLSVPIDRGE